MLIVIDDCYNIFNFFTGFKNPAGTMVRRRIEKDTST